MRREHNREFVAHHEAAHAVVARHLGVPCLGIMMFRTDDKGSAGALTQSAAHNAGDSRDEQIEGSKRDGIVALAGPSANVRFAGRSMRSTGAGSDIAVAKNAALRVACLLAGYSVSKNGGSLKVDADVLERADVIVREWQDEAENLVSEHWPKIERVAQVLLTADLIAETDLDRLISGVHR